MQLAPTVAGLRQAGIGLSTIVLKVVLHLLDGGSTASPTSLAAWLDHSLAMCMRVLTTPADGDAAASHVCSFG